MHLFRLHPPARPTRANGSRQRASLQASDSGHSGHEAARRAGAGESLCVSWCVSWCRGVVAPFVSAPLFAGREFIEALHDVPYSLNPQEKGKSMKLKLLVVALFWLLVSTVKANANGRADTLAYWLAKSSLVIAGQITQGPRIRSSEAGVMNYSFKFKVSEVLAGTAPEAKEVSVIAIRFESTRQDQLPFLQPGGECILFLQPVEDKTIPGWKSVDKWFGIQPYLPRMASSVKRLAAATKAQKTLPEKTSPEKTTLEAEVARLLETLHSDLLKAETKRCAPLLIGRDHESAKAAIDFFHDLKAVSMLSFGLENRNANFAIGAYMVNALSEVVLPGDKAVAQVAVRKLEGTKNLGVLWGNAEEMDFAQYQQALVQLLGKLTGKTLPPMTQNKRLSEEQIVSVSAGVRAWLQASAPGD